MVGIAKIFFRTRGQWGGASNQGRWTPQPVRRCPAISPPPRPLRIPPEGWKLFKNTSRGTPDPRCRPDLPGPPDLVRGNLWASWRGIPPPSQGGVCYIYRSFCRVTEVEIWHWHSLVIFITFSARGWQPPVMHAPWTFILFFSHGPF